MATRGRSGVPAFFRSSVLYTKVSADFPIVSPARKRVFVLTELGGTFQEISGL